MSHSVRPLARAAVGALLLVASRLPAQTAPPPPPPVPAPTPAPAPKPKPAPRRWTGGASVNGSILFGNSDQRVVGGRGTIGRADSVVQLTGDLQALYGDASVEGGRRTLIKRLWLGTLAMDYRPHDRTSPFVSGTFESNYEKRIVSRYSTGAGVKQTFVRSARTETSLSVALLDERTVPRSTTGPASPKRLTRWSWRGRVQHQFDEKVRVTHVTFWQPDASRLARYLLRSTTEVVYQATKKVGLTFSFLDSYDSEATARGARVNNDGQMMFGAAARW